METQKTICRLCLKLCDSFKALEGNMKDLLVKLLPKINLAAIQKPMACTNCAEILKKCFDFKAMCFNAHENIISLVNNKNAVTLNLTGVPLMRNKNGTGISEDQDICEFCLSPLKNCLTITPYVARGDIMLEKMIEQCFSELDLSINKKPVICTPCYESLEIYFRFVTNCLIIEEKIRKYCKSLDISSGGQIELNQLLQFTMRDVKSEADGNWAGIINVEQLCEERDNADDREIGKGCAIKLEQMSYDDSEDAKVDIKYETKSCMDMSALNLNNEEQFTPNNMLVCKEESDSLDVIKIEETICGEIKVENLVEMEDQKFLPAEEIEIKTDDLDFYRFKDGVVLSHLEVARRLPRSRKRLMSNVEGSLLGSNTKHTLTKKYVSKIRMHQCDCCSFQTKYKNYLKRHLLVHRNPSEVTMYKCDSCSFQTKRKGSLRKHLLVHRDPSEVTMHKCDSCSYQTNCKTNLKRHLQVHIDPSEAVLYKHTLTKKHVSKIKMHQCNWCSYQTKYKCRLEKHLLVHRNPSEVTMYKCYSCSFQTKYKRSLKQHLLVHRNPSEVTMYKCDSCSYQTNCKNSLRQHLLVHMDPSEAAMYKCDTCSYQTNCKNSLKIHLLRHKDPSEIPVYKCSSCSFRTKYERGLKKHLLVHMDPSEVTMYKCDSCSFQTKYKRCLKIHFLVHRNRSEVIIHKCNFCSFQTKRKASCTRHILRLHKDLS